MCNSDLKQNTAIVDLNEYIVLKNRCDNALSEIVKLQDTIQNIKDGKTVFVQKYFGGMIIHNETDAIKQLESVIVTYREKYETWIEEHKKLSNMSVWEFVKYKFKKQD